MGGGVCEEQLDLIREKGCYDALINCHAAIFGVSAGSMNMARKTVDFFESMEAFDGLGFTNITVRCHHDPKDEWRYEQTLRMSEDRTVYAMEDMSAFFIKEGRIDVVGTIYRVENRELQVLTEEEIKRAIRKGTIEMKITPVLCGSSFKNKGVQQLLNAVVDYLPSPIDIDHVKGVHPKTGKEEERKNLLEIYNNHPLVNNYELAKQEVESLLLVIKNIID